LEGIEATKALWIVRAGVIVGEPIAQYTRSWVYTSRDYDLDQTKGPEEMTRFSEIVLEVQAYSTGLTDPTYVNWVNSSFTWI
jgi:hypothetical protein